MKSKLFSHFYKVNLKNPRRVIHAAIIGIIVYMFSFGAVMAFFPIRPFWNDEWRLMYNIKFKSLNELWGTLDLLQECPRVYLSILKIIGSNFDYSYTSFRFPPLIIGLASIFLLFYLHRKLFPGRSLLSYLFILILISSQTFTDYLVQVKQYEMDIFLCLVALWQLMVVLRINKEGISNRVTYFLLCLSFLVAPYFSYVYPITVAPIFLIVFLDSVSRYKNREASHPLFFKWLIMPLLLVAFSIVVFYFIDVKNLLADKRMYQSYLMAYYQGGRESFAEDFWKLFSLVGSGFVFEIIFGILGVVSFFYGLYQSVRVNWNTLQKEDYFRLYALLLLFLVLVLFLSGKLIGGVARLTAYAVPFISLLLISLLESLRNKEQYRKPVRIMSSILFLALFGNIISSFINSFTYPEYNERIKTFRETSKALKLARLKKIPLLYTDGVRGDQPAELPAKPGNINPYTITPEQIEGVDKLAAEAILKVNPEYKVWDTIPVFFIPDLKWIEVYMDQLPEQYESAVVGDGLHFKRISR